MESKKAKERLNLINKTQISIKNRELNCVPLRRGVLAPHGKYSFLFHRTQSHYHPLFPRAHRTLPFSFKNTDLARVHFAMILRWLLPQLKNWLQTKHNNAFGVYRTVDKLFDRGSCINSFTETGKRPQPTRLQGTSTRSDRGPLDPGDLNTFTIAAVTLKKHDLIDKKHKSRKRGKFSTISLGSNRANTSRGQWK